MHVPRKAPSASGPERLHLWEARLHWPMLSTPGTAPPPAPAQGSMQSTSCVQDKAESSCMISFAAACAMGTNVNEVPAIETIPVPTDLPPMPPVGVEFSGGLLALNTLLALKLPQWH